MNRLFAPQNTPHFFMIVVALVGRWVLGAIPLIGGLFSFVLMLVILYHLFRIAMNLLRAQSVY